MKERWKKYALIALVAHMLIDTMAVVGVVSVL